MNQFFDFDSAEQLLGNSRGDVSARIAEKNRVANMVLEQGVSRAGWRRLRPGDRLEVPSHGRVIVLGVVVWNAEDREVLNMAAEQLFALEGVIVFDLDDVHSPGDLEAFMPFVTMPLRTPVAAEYREGVLLRHSSGPDVRMLIPILAKT
jgi:hypothetical protein